MDPMESYGSTYATAPPKAGTTRSLERIRANGGAPAELVDASRQFEGVFLNMVFEEMAKTVPKDGLFGHSSGLDMVQSWLRTEISERWAASGGVGLGDQLAQSLGAASPPRATESRFPLPVDGVVTSGFGRRVHPVSGEVDWHGGVDIAVPAGSPVRTPFPGRVISIGESDHLGRTVLVEHKGGYRTLYGHVEASTVQVGDNLKSGDVVALSGNSGRSTGPHLHFSMYLRNQPIDPATWLPELGGVGTTTVNKNSVRGTSSL